MPCSQPLVDIVNISVSAAAAAAAEALGLGGYSNFTARVLVLD